MDPILPSLISSAVYDMVKAGALLTVDKLKGALTQYITSERHAEIIAENIRQMEIDRSMSEYASEGQIRSEPSLMEILRTLPPQERVVVQTHSGSGDNVAGDKYGR